MKIFPILYFRQVLAISVILLGRSFNSFSLFDRIMPCHVISSFLGFMVCIDDMYWLYFELVFVVAGWWYFRLIAAVRDMTLIGSFLGIPSSECWNQLAGGIGRFYYGDFRSLFCLLFTFCFFNDHDFFL